MILGFLPKIAAIEGNITLKEHLRAVRHLILCAQSIVMTFGPLNFLYLVIPATLCGIYSQQAHPQPPIQPGNTPLYHPQITQIQNSLIREAWQVATKHFEEYQNTNKALTECFMSMLLNEYQLGYTKILTREHNHIFKIIFNYFYNKFGQEDGIEIEQNKEGTKETWHTRERSQILKQ